MSAQKQELGKNYIGILTDQAEEQRAIDAVAKSRHLFKDCVLPLMATLLNRLAHARSFR